MNVPLITLQSLFIQQNLFKQMLRSRTVSKPEVLKAQVQVFTKQQFNYKRNNSNLMSTCLSWDWAEPQQIQINQPYPANRYSSTQLINQTFEVRGQQPTLTQTGTQQKDVSKGQHQPRLKSALKKQQQRGKSVPQKDFSKYEKTPAEIIDDEKKAEQRKQKIKDYIESMVPFSRNFTDSKFQHYYQKSAPIAYGNANTHQLIGGVIYGNNLRTFNVNPHDYQNNPKTYQSYNTALNFGVRCKRDEAKHWKRLQKQLGKKLNLYEKNPTLQDGKKVVYVDVTDQNMYDTMKQNLEFKKQHRDEIRKDEQNYQHLKEMRSAAEREKFYRNNAEKTKQNLERTMAETLYNDRDEADRIGEQVIYKHHDKDGNVRIGADRHALTCFVDINFPENDQLYTEELKKRNQIFPIEVEDRHKNLAEKKRQNFEKSLNIVYPSHYLLLCNEQPEIQKMLMQKSKQLDMVNIARRKN